MLVHSEEMRKAVKEMNCIKLNRQRQAEANLWFDESTEL